MKRNLHATVLIVTLMAALVPSVPGETVPSWSQPTRDRPALDVPYVPTPPEVVAKMLSIADVTSRDILYDLGCGDGRIVVTAAKERKVRKAVGFDLDPQRIRESNENARLAGVTEQVSFQQKNLFDVDLGEASVLSLYLLPSVNLQLRPKLFRELRPGTRVVSHDFDMAAWKPDRTVSVDGHTIYFWVVPANASGAWTWSLAGSRQKQRYELRLSQQFQNVDSAELLVDGELRPVRDAHVTGDRLEFMTVSVLDGRRQALRFRGAVQGNSIRGTVAAPDHPDSAKKWSAARRPFSAEPLERQETQKQIQVKNVAPAAPGI